MLDNMQCGLVVVDVQGKLARLVDNSEALIASLQALIQGCQHLDLPIIRLEQYPRGLGPTVPEVAQLFTAGEPLGKTSFSACGTPAFSEALQASGRRQWLVCGIETHVCVYQTVMALLDRGCEVEVVADAVSSRSAFNREIALQKMQAAGAGLTTVEMCLYELLGHCEHPAFKSILNLLR